MLAERLEEDRRQQVRPGPATRGRMERCRGLRDLLALAAGDLLPHRLDRLPPPQDHLQRLGDILAHLHDAIRAAAGVGGARSSPRRPRRPPGPAPIRSRRPRHGPPRRRARRAIWRSRKRSLTWPRAVTRASESPCNQGLQARSIPPLQGVASSVDCASRSPPEDTRAGLRRSAPPRRFRWSARGPSRLPVAWCRATFRRRRARAA